MRVDADKGPTFNHTQNPVPRPLTDSKLVVSDTSALEADLFGNILSLSLVFNR
jgi:hypothetical protein